MKVLKTGIKDCYIIEPTVYEDDRGYFFESYNQTTFNKLTGLDIEFVQDNQSKSSYGVIRGLHTQKGDYAQAKLVRVLEGEVLDVIVDYRKDSPSYGKIEQVRLSAENKRQFFVPRGCLHGFAVLSDKATFFYKCDNYYHKAAEAGVKYNDTQLNIDWGITEDQALVSPKDKKSPSWEEFISTLNH